MRPIYLVSKTSHHETEGVTHVPILSIHFLTPSINFSQYDGIVVTSKQGALALSHYSPDWDRLQVVCVGDSTAHTMRELGAKHIETANGYGERLLDVLMLQKDYKKWLYCRPKMIASSWPSRARERGIVIDEVIVYETLCNKEMEDVQIAMDGVLIFTSPSGIECFQERYTLLPTYRIVVIGKTTKNALPVGIESMQSENTSVESCVKMAKELAV